MHNDELGRYVINVTMKYYMICNQRNDEILYDMYQRNDEILYNM